MPSFFNISEEPTPKQYSQGIVSDPVHRSETESGAFLSRTRSTAVPRTRPLVYPSVSHASKLIIEAWEKDTVGYGGESFNWRDPHSGVQYVAKLAKPIEYKLRAGHPHRWQVNMSLVLLAESSSSSSLSSSSSSSSSSSFSSSSSLSSSSSSSSESSSSSSSSSSA